MTYRAFGKQVKRGDEHIADAASDTYAQIIADALNGEREPYVPGAQLRRDAIRECRDPLRDAISNPSIVIEPKHIGTDFATEPDQTAYAKFEDYKLTHSWQRQQDEYACSCGARWDIADGDDHP